MPKVLGGSEGGGSFLMGEVPLYGVVDLMFELPLYRGTSLIRTPPLPRP